METHASRKKLRQSSGAVYVVDGAGITHSNIAEEKEEKPLSIYDVKLHGLSEGDEFNLLKRRPGEVSRRQATQVVVKELERTEAQA